MSLNPDIINAKRDFNLDVVNYFYKDIKTLNFNNYIELRKIVSQYSFTDTVVTAPHQHWSTVYYNITKFPYTYVELSTNYDNIIQGVNTFQVSLNGGGVLLNDTYLLNSTTNRTTANLVSSLTGSNITDTNSNFIDYEKGICVFNANNVELISFDYSTSVRLKENIYICEILKNECNKTTNPSAYKDNVTYIDDYTIPYVTTVGLYDTDGDLVAIAKLSSPLRLSDKLDTIIKISIDM